MGSVIVLFIFSSSLVVIASTKIARNKLGARTLFLILGILCFIVCLAAQYMYVLEIVPDFEVQRAKYFYDRAVEAQRG